MKQKLTPKQRAFADNKSAGMTNRDAAIAAGYAVAAADQSATKLMNHPGIRAAIKTATRGTSASDDKASALAMPRDHYDDSLTFLVDVMNHAHLPIAVRGDAAKQLLPYQHARKGELGKKEKAKDAAREIAGGTSKFATKKPPPALHLVRAPE